MSRRAPAPSRARRAGTVAAPQRSAGTPGSRPLRDTPRAVLLQDFALALETADGEGAAHCIHELWLRGEPPGGIEHALGEIWRACAASVPEWLPMRYVDWLPQAYEIASRFEAHARGRSNIYLVLLDNRRRRGGSDYGVYVGMSAYAPAQRFDQHMAGIRAAGCVLKRGLEVLTGPVLHLQRIARRDAMRIERDLALALGDAGLAVEGGH